MNYLFVSFIYSFLLLGYHTTRRALRCLNCHEEGAVQLGNALRAEPGGISGPHCPVGLCPSEEYWENPGKG